MRSIADSFSQIISSQVKLGYHMPNILSGPASSNEIKAAELELDVELVMP